MVYTDVPKVVIYNDLLVHCENNYFFVFQFDLFPKNNKMNTLKHYKVLFVREEEIGSSSFHGTLYASQVEFTRFFLNSLGEVITDLIDSSVF